MAAAAGVVLVVQEAAGDVHQHILTVAAVEVLPEDHRLTETVVFAVVAAAAVDRTLADCWDSVEVDTAAAVGILLDLTVEVDTDEAVVEAVEEEFHLLLLRLD